MLMRYKSSHSAINPPVNVVNGWARWLERRGFTGTLQEMEAAYLQSKEFESWSEHLMDRGYYGHFDAQCTEFWKDVSRLFAEPPMRMQRLIHCLATTRFGAWYIQKYLGMKGRIAA